MRKLSYFWVALSLAFLFLLPIYSMAQTQMKLTLEDIQGNRISTPGIKSFSIGTDNNLIIYLDQPFKFKDLYPDIILGSCSPTPQCTKEGPAEISAIQGTTLSFTVGSDPNVRIDLVAASYEIGGTVPRTIGTGSGTFSWNTGETLPGTYLAVFEAIAGTDTSTSQIVVMIKVVPPVPPPNAPTNLSGSATATQVSLSWNDNSTDEQGFRIERKTATAGWTQIGQVPANVRTYTDNNVSVGNTYTYRVFAYNEGGNSGYSNEFSATPTQVPVPDPPSNLSATPGNAQVTLSWTDNSTNETGFYIERNGATIAQVGQNTTTYTDTNLTNGTVYTYRVCAYNSSGNSNWSASASATPTVTGGIGTKDNPVVLDKKVKSDLSWYGYNANYNGNYVIPRGKSVWFKIDPTLVGTGQNIKITVYRYGSTSSGTATFIAVDRRTNQEVGTVGPRDWSMVTLGGPYDPGYYYLVELKEGGIADTGMSIWWNFY